MEHIVLIGHGSPRKDANRIDVVGSLLHRIMHPGCRGGCVKVAYLQFAEPGIAEAIDACVREGARKIIVHPFFLSAGMHVTADIPAMLDEARGRHPGVEFVYTEPLGIHEKLAHVVIERIRAAAPLGPGDIEKRSFEIISEELDLSDIPEERLPVVTRVIHATADMEFRDTLLFHPEAVRAGIAAIQAGKDILTDVEMVRTGINKRLLERWGGRVLCEMPKPGDDDQSAADEGAGACRTRAERGVESALKAHRTIGVVAIGNAPTALMKVIEVFDSPLRPADPCVVVGVPVGFVNALESKTLLAAQEFPFITTLSRKGGTPVAVAIVNALLRMAGEGS
jgi:precorrin-8X/cobalt-precorrin-8 methylmutase